MNQNVAATAAIDGNVMVSQQNLENFLIFSQEEIIIPHDKCGIVIGKNGNTLRNLRSQVKFRLFICAYYSVVWMFGKSRFNGEFWGGQASANRRVS